MAKLFCRLRIVVIAIASAIPIVIHIWEPPQDISPHGQLIDEQMSETMAEAGISLPGGTVHVRLFSSGNSRTVRQDERSKLSGWRQGMVIAAFVWSALEVLALGVFGTKAWASIYFTPAAARRDAGAGAGWAVCLLFPLSRAGWKVRTDPSRHDQRRPLQNFFGLDPDP